MDKEINHALEKARKFLVETQSEYGNWIRPVSEAKGPDQLQKPIVTTSGALKSLIYLGEGAEHEINKAIFYCYKEKIDENETIEILASQLDALSYSNTPFIEKKSKNLLKLILSRQNKEGYWPSFPKTSSLTNFIVVESIKRYNCKENIKNLRNWLLKTKAKDNLGWGIDEKSAKSEVSFTANSIICLISAGEDLQNKDIQKAVEFFESKQLGDGGWPSSELTYPLDSTTYATSLVLLILLKTKENIIESIIEKGIRFLLDTQLEDGSWPLKKGDSVGEYFTTFYAVRTLAYYKYIKNKLKNEDVIELLKKIKDKRSFINYLFNEFEIETRNNFFHVNHNKIIDKILATTGSAVKRRKMILNILQNEGEKDNADIIDALKRLNGYGFLHKRSHLAQIKNDMDALVNLGFVEEQNRKYFLVRKITSP